MTEENAEPKPALDVPVEDIPVPPKDLWPELDNAPAEGAAQEKPEEAPAPPEVVKLDFVETEKVREKTVPLDFPFRLDGDVVEEITVRRLTVSELGEALGRRLDGREDKFEIYAAMTGFPAPVLRGLVDADGERVTEVAFDFLPPLLKGGGG